MTSAETIIGAFNTLLTGFMDAVLDNDAPEQAMLGVFRALSILSNRILSLLAVFVMSSKNEAVGREYANYTRGVVTALMTNTWHLEQNGYVVNPDAPNAPEEDKKNDTDDNQN